MELVIFFGLLAGVFTWAVRDADRRNAERRRWEAYLAMSQQQLYMASGDRMPSGILPGTGDPFPWDEVGK